MIEVTASVDSSKPATTGVAAETKLYLLSFFVLPSLLTEVWSQLL